MKASESPLRAERDEEPTMRRGVRRGCSMSDFSQTHNPQPSSVASCPPPADSTAGVMRSTSSEMTMRWGLPSRVSVDLENLDLGRSSSINAALGGADGERGGSCTSPRSPMAEGDRGSGGNGNDSCMRDGTVRAGRHKPGGTAGVLASAGSSSSATSFAPDILPPHLREEGQGEEGQGQQQQLQLQTTHSAGLDSDASLRFRRQCRQWGSLSAGNVR